MKIAKGVVTGLGIASLLIALPAEAKGSKESSQSSGSSGATSGAATETSSGQAGSQMGSESSGPGATGGAAGGTASAGAAGEQHLTGKVEKVDQSKHQLTLQLKVDESTQVMKDGKTASLSDIKEGDQVRASFRGDQVERIEVMSSGAGGEQEPSPRGGATQPGGSSPGRGY